MELLLQPNLPSTCVVPICCFLKILGVTCVCGQGFLWMMGGRCSASLAGLVRTKAGVETGKSRPFYTLPGWHIFPGLGCSVVASFLFTIFTCFSCGSLFIRV